MGMGYQEISAFNSPPFFQTLVAHGRVDHPQFAFKLAEEGSELYLGGTNRLLYKGDFTYVPVTEKVSLELIGAYRLSNCLRRVIGKLSSMLLPLMVCLFYCLNRMSSSTPAQPSSLAIRTM